jgi:hypothetical protein
MGQEQMICPFGTGLSKPGGAGWVAALRHDFSVAIRHPIAAPSRSMAGECQHITLGF